MPIFQSGREYLSCCDAHDGVLPHERARDGAPHDGAASPPHKAHECHCAASPAQKAEIHPPWKVFAILFPDKPQALVDEKEEQLNNAATAAEVEEVYESIETVVNDTDAAVKEAEEELNLIEADFNNAVEALEAATNEYNDLMEAFEDNGELFGRNKDTAEEEAVKARDKVDALKAKAEALKDAADAAKEKYEGISEVKRLEDAIVADLMAGKTYASGTTTIIEYFEAVVRYYYIPEVVGGKTISIERMPFTGNNFWTDNCIKVSSQGDVLNYYIVK